MFNIKIKKQTNQITVVKAKNMIFKGKKNRQDNLYDEIVIYIY